MIDWLLVWGVTQGVGILVQPILEELATDAAKDVTKDFFKDALKKVIHLPEKDVQKEAYGKALKVFLELIQDELEEAEYQEPVIKAYIPYLKKLINHGEVAASLGMAFEVDCRSIDTRLITKTWADLNSPHFPESLNWDFLSTSYVKAVKKIVRSSEKLRPIFAVQIQEQIADGVQELKGIAPGFDLGQYAEGLKERYGNLKLESLNTDGCAYNALKLWRMFVPQQVRECQEFMPQVYELPKDRSRLLQEAGQLDVLAIQEGELEDYRQRYQEQPIKPIFEVVGDPQIGGNQGTAKYAVILGDPGSGKSTLLQYLALVWAELPVRDLPLQPLPLLLELRTYARDRKEGKCQGIVEFIHGGNFICRLHRQELHAKLKKGDAIALFDGIDEVFDPELREEVVTDIHRFTNEYPLVRVVATSRWLGYKAQKLRDAEFQHFMLQDLDDEQIEDFLQRWHDRTFAEGLEKEQKRERLQKAIRESKSIHELAGNPLLLTMMAILNRNQELPRHRAELYQKASEVLLHQWDFEANKPEHPELRDWKIIINNTDKQAMLRKVAYHMQAEPKDLSGNLISEIELENILTDYLRTIIENGEPRMVARFMIKKQLQTRNFILCDLGGNSYGFVHRTFLEYFCASEFVWQFKEGQTLLKKQLIQDVFGSHWQEESWHEILKLVCGMIEPKFVAEIIDFLLKQEVDKNSFLENNGLKKEGLFNLLLAADCFFEVRNRSLIPATSSKLLKALKSEVEGETLYEFQHELAVRLINKIINILGNSSETLAWLKKCLKSNQESFIPASSVKGIAQGWKDDPDTLPLLKNLALSDQHGYVRGAAVQEIAQGWKDDPDTLPLLKDIALNDQHYFVRWMAVQEITEGWKDDPDTLPLLKYRVLNDQSWNVRKTSLEEIAKGWKDEPDTLLLLKACALNDQHYFVRWAAIKEIAEGWKDEPDTLLLLKACTLNDQCEYIQRAAVQEIAKGWKDDPDTLPWFKDLALKDQRYFVRWAVVQEIAKGWKDGSQIFDFLYDFALQDSFIREKDWELNPRQTALEAILEYYSDNPQTLELLHHVANNDPDKKLKQFAQQELAKLSK